ncbi:EamA family transporter RarD [Phenylobacterium sp.]|uniref:EamA family transporter RarD n=1 Tax=Phenylobacterium sp. TaxID=1871053 RepID=UPI0025E857DC|nr:EamA family transporter RarD [Phenylobacterium sp.]MBX3484534.1 EamA family transporter RarD [Phenylobacterium sp.]
MSSSSEPGEARLALTAGITCYLIWGFVPLAFQAINALGASSWEIVAHRIVWGAPTALILALVARQGRQILAVLRNPRTLAWLTLSTVLIASNWGVYIWSVTSGRVLEGSFGYYVTPLVNMASGALIFRERIDRTGVAAMALAAVGVLFQGLALGHLPLISLTLALSFGGYGIVRKQVQADAQTGLFIECLMLLVPALVFIGWLESRGAGHFVSSPASTIWLIAAGPITALPLALFSWCARRLPLSTMAFLQFIGPTIGFAIGVSQGEPFTALHATSFGFIWAGAAVFLVGAWRRSRAIRAAVAETAPAG